MRSDRAFTAPYLVRYVVVGACAAGTVLIVAELAGDRTPAATAPVPTPMLGELAWHASCPIVETNGLCVERVAPKPSGDVPTRCGPEGIDHLVVVPRDLQLVARARALIHGSRAQLLDLDLELEQYLAIVPTQLGLQAYLAAKSAGAQALSAKYEALDGSRDPEIALAALARTGELVDQFANQVLTVDIPADIRTGEIATEKIDAYCDAMVGVVEPLEHRALQAFDRCLTRSIELGVFTTTSAHCAAARAVLEGY